jgi:hypothetical protein
VIKNRQDWSSPPNIARNRKIGELVHLDIELFLLSCKGICTVNNIGGNDVVDLAVHTIVVGQLWLIS